MRSGNVTSNSLNAAAAGNQPGVPSATGGAPGVVGAAAPAGVAVQGGPGGGGGVGGKEKGTAQHVLGTQRPGFGAATQGGGQGRTVLTMEDLGMAVGEYGVVSFVFLLFFRWVLIRHWMVRRMRIGLTFGRMFGEESSIGSG